MIYFDPTGHWMAGDEKLNDESKAKMIALTTAEKNAKTKAEKNKILKQEQAIRNNRVSWVGINDSLIVIQNEDSFDTYMSKAMKNGVLSYKEWKSALNMINAKVNISPSYSSNQNILTVTTNVTTSIGIADIKVNTGAIYKGTNQPTATIDCGITYNIDYNALTKSWANCLKEWEISMYEEYLKQLSESSTAIYFSIEMDNMSFCMDYSNAMTAVLRGLASANRLDELYKDSNSNSMQKGAVKTAKPYSKSRPSYGSGQVDKVWENAADINGKVYDPNTGEELSWDRSKLRSGQWDMGHTPENKYSDMHQKYINGEISKEEFIEWYRDPNNYRPESPSANRSHKYEK